MTKVRDSLKFILITQFAMFVTMVLDIPVARQIIGFVYVSFIPGILILRILRFNLESRTNTIIFSVGLSLAFLMFVGLIVNELYPLMGVSEPLSILPLSFTIGTILLVMSFFSYKTHDLERSFSLPSISQVLRAFLLMGLPILVIIGALLTNSLLLSIMISAIVVLVMATALSRRLIPHELYVIVILVIAISLMFQSEFISKYLMGWDVFGEFYVFRVTNANSFWNPALPLPVEELLDFNAMLSITILPTIYSSLLNIQGDLIFKVVYLLLYSLVPVSLYQMYKQEFGKSIAFLSAFYFVLFPRFYSEERRQIIGELFLVLLIFLILAKDVDLGKKRILLYIFGAALVVSHYSISYIFMFSILFAFVFMSIANRISKTKYNLGKKSVINSSFVILIFVLNFSWALVSHPTVINLFEFVGYVASSFTTSFLSLETRGDRVSEFFAPDYSSMSLTNKADYIINKIPYILIIIGFIVLIKKMRARAKMNTPLEYLPLVSANISMLLMVTVLPFFAPAFLTHRFYHVSLLFLAPICVLGGETFLMYILKPLIDMKRARSICLVILYIIFVVIFLFKVGFIHEVTGDVPISRSVSFTRIKTSHDPEITTMFYNAYVPEQDVYSAIWLSDMTNRNSTVYADLIASQHVLRAYSMTIIEWDCLLNNNTAIGTNAYIYFRHLNVDESLREQGMFSNTTRLYSQLRWTNKIYSNGDSEIHYSLPSD